VFTSVLGHRRILELLSRSVARGSVPPSLIFAGPRGVGKRRVAEALAQAVNCLAPLAGDGAASRPLPFDACGDCAACSRIARGVHPDVVIVEPGDTGSIKIDAVRDLIERAAYRPFEGRRRVAIVDDADAMVGGAQNALLKTLEEPPSASIFILVTSRPDVLLDTVRSRCPRLRFRPLSEDDIASALVARGTSASKARTIAASAEGSLGRALETTGDELVDARDAAMRVLGYAVASDDPRRRLEGAKELLTKISSGPERAQVATTLRALSSLLRDISILSAKGDRATLANADLETALGRMTTVLGGERGVRAFQAVDQALVAVDRNAGVKVVADWLILQL
jgi:DNA polymerase-3 subunit delta'